MKTSRNITLSSLALLGLLMGLAIYSFWPHNHLEIQVRDTKLRSDGRWTAVVQMEVYNSAVVVNDAVYAVRLKGPAQKDRQGDLVMNVPVNYPAAEPTINWNNGNLIVTLTDHQKYQYLANLVNGVQIIVQQR